MHTAAAIVKRVFHDVIMMGTEKGEAQLFSYAMNLETRLRATHPLAG